MAESDTPRTHGRYALVPTHNRPDMLAELVAVITREVDLFVIIDNASSPPVSLKALREAAEYPRGQIWVIRDEEQPPNLARMWNAGFDAIYGGHAQREGFATWDIAVLNDDALPHAGWLTTVADAMRADERRPAAACMLPIDRTLLKREPDRDIHRRMYGPAFVCRGELTVELGQPVDLAPLLRADERMRWWWQDTDFDWQARALGGMLVVPGPHVPNRLANSTTVGELGEQAGRDGAIFVEKWGYRPW